ncbi:hypothetical protein EJB05_46969, partial [Eragrostis curvula]
SAICRPSLGGSAVVAHGRTYASALSGSSAIVISRIRRPLGSHSCRPSGLAFGQWLQNRHKFTPFIKGKEMNQTMRMPLWRKSNLLIMLPLTELNLRFNEKVMDLLYVSLTLVPKSGFASFQASEICKMVEKYYPADFNQQERIGLGYQLNHFVVEASRNDDLKTIATLAELCRCLVDTGRHRVFHLIDRLLRLLITLPVSTASAERAFSVLKFVKTRLGNKMEDDFLANSMLVHIEGELLADYSYD